MLSCWVLVSMINLTVLFFFFQIYSARLYLFSRAWMWNPLVRNRNEPKLLPACTHKHTHKCQTEKPASNSFNLNIRHFSIRGCDANGYFEGWKWRREKKRKSNSNRKFNLFDSKNFQEMRPGREGENATARSTFSKIHAKYFCLCARVRLRFHWKA